MTDPSGSTSPALMSRNNPSPVLSAVNPQPNPSMAPPDTPAPHTPFHRFRINETQRTGTPSAPPPPGQLTRFRVTDFIDQSTMNGARPRSSSGASPQQLAPPGTLRGLPGTGSFSIMRMDVDRTAAQNTSNSVIGTSGRGRLQKVKAPVAPLQQQHQQQYQPVRNVPMSPQIHSQLRPIAMSSSPTLVTSPTVMPAAKFDPTKFPEDVRYELARVLSLIQSNPTELVTKIIAALLSAPSLEEKSLLRHIGSLYPVPPPPPPPPPPTAAPVPQNTTEKTQVSAKRKRGRPPGKKKDGSSAPPAAASAEMSPMAPPLMKQPALPSIAPSPVGQAPTQAQSPDLPTLSPGMQTDSPYQTCTRCLKRFDPAWRPTPASDPSSEQTCAVRHPYPDYQSGLVVVPTRKRNNYNKSAWRWKCCGREIQSASDEFLCLPRKEDDKTGGWCFVGRHTVEPGVREKLGLKSGKGRTIDELTDASQDVLESARKRAKMEGRSGSNSGGQIAPAQLSTQQSPSMSHAHIQPAQTQQPWPQDTTAYMTTPPQPQPPPQPPAQSPRFAPPPSPTVKPDTPASDLPKRKRGRPKGSKSKGKSISIPTDPTPVTETISSGTQLLAEASSQPPAPILAAPVPVLAAPAVTDHLVANGEPGSGSSNFWAQYTEPIPELGSSASDHDATVGTDSMGISSVDLGMLVNATAAMDSGADNTSPGKSAQKRGRGRPKGVKNGTGKLAAEKKRMQQEVHQQAQQQHDQNQQQQNEQREAQQDEDEVDDEVVQDEVVRSHHHHTGVGVPNGAATEVTTLGAGGGWFPGDDQDQPWGGFG